MGLPTVTGASTESFIEETHLSLDEGTGYKTTTMRGEGWGREAVRWEKGL